jgi:3-isopropylmalate/(R)-2-methylmalate dehydratase small subunit
MEPIITFSATAAALPTANVDTDQIIPAKYLKVTDKSGLAKGLFEAWRYLPDGSPNPDFVLNRPEHAGSQILIAGDNFGCGSSREHAPWALTSYGIKAVVSTSFADIFRSNSLKNGLLPIVVDEDTYHELVSICEEDPEAELTVDLAAQRLVLPGGRAVGFPIDGFSKHCLLNGVDELGFILNEEDAVAAYEASAPRTVNTQA